MDSLTQILLGSAVAAAVAPKTYRKRAILTGAILGTLPDLDVVFRYASDVDNFTHHRGFSHSLLVLPWLALLLLPLLRPLYHSLTRQRLYLLALLPLITHPLLDALTAYGTQLFWPLTVTPTFIGSVFIVDPFYTTWLLIGVFAYLIRSQWRWINTTGLVLGTLYLGLGISLQGVAKSRLLAAYPQTTADAWFVGVLTASPFCWRGVYKNKTGYIETAFNVLNPAKMAEQRYEVLPPSAYPQSAAWQRLQWFNPDTVLRKRGDQLVSSDLRMGEFGSYVFEFIISPPSLSGNRLPMSGKPSWSPHFSSSAAEDYHHRNHSPNYIKRKWSQIFRCLAGES